MTGGARRALAVVGGLLSGWGAAATAEDEWLTLVGLGIGVMVAAHLREDRVPDHWHDDGPA